MVKILKDVLGHHLFVPDPEQLSRDKKWLSPEELKHKVVIRMKVKPGACWSQVPTFKHSNQQHLILLLFPD
jgi:hypothetical protein